MLAGAAPQNPAVSAYVLPSAGPATGCPIVPDSSKQGLLEFMVPPPAITFAAITNGSLPAGGVDGPMSDSAEAGPMQAAKMNNKWNSNPDRNRWVAASVGLATTFSIQVPCKFRCDGILLCNA